MVAAELERDLERLVEEDIFADAVLRGSDGEVAVHLAMLNVRCPNLVPHRQDQPTCKRRRTMDTERTTDHESKDEAEDKDKGKDKAKVVIPVEGTTRQTLFNLVFFLYTDKLKENLTCTEIMSLMVLTGQILAQQPEGEGLPPCRLFDLCERRIRKQLDLSNAVEVLLCALSNKFAFLEQSVYELLSSKQVKSVDFCASLVDAMIPAHESELKYAIAAIGGDKDPRKMSAIAKTGALCQRSMRDDLQMLLAQATGKDWPGSESGQYFVDCGINGAGEAAVFGAHRFMLAVRSDFLAGALCSDMQEGKFRFVQLGVQPPPSKKALEALLSFIYTATWDVRSADQSDCIDLLSILGNDYLKLSGFQGFHSEVTQHVLSLGNIGNPWQLLRRATAADNEEVKTAAKRWVLEEWHRLRKDPVARKASCAPPAEGEDECPWWTSADEAAMVKEVFLSSEVEQLFHLVPSCRKLNWTLTVENPHHIAEGYCGVYNDSGNRHLKTRDLSTGSSTNPDGAIQASFAETVHVNSVIVAPMVGHPLLGKPALRRAVLQVKSETGEWDTINNELTGDVQRVSVQRTGKEWRLFGTNIATSMFIFE